MAKHAPLRIAFVKFGGLSSGGTEKFLQTVAANLDRSAFNVSYIYCDTAPYIGSGYRHAGTDTTRKAYLEEADVKLLEFSVGAKDVRLPTHDWVDTDFWDVFREDDFDLIFTGRAGHPEYPFNRIRSTPIIDSLHLSAGVDNQFNISRVLHISAWSREKWVSAGGDRSRTELVSHPIELATASPSAVERFKSAHGLASKFIFGFHQRAAEEIFSPVPLTAFAQVAGPDDHFVLLGGAAAYRDQARELGLEENITFVDYNSDPVFISAFLQSLDVYAHGRADGEVNSTAMAEALGHSLPVVSHLSPINNGHVECLGMGGVVVGSTRNYAEELKRLKTDADYYEKRSTAAQARFIENYDLEEQIARIEKVLLQAASDPYPRRLRRRALQMKAAANPRRLVQATRAQISTHT